MGSLQVEDSLDDCCYCCCTSCDACLCRYWKPEPIIYIYLRWLRCAQRPGMIAQIPVEGWSRRCIVNQDSCGASWGNLQKRVHANLLSFFLVNSSRACNDSQLHLSPTRAASITSCIMGHPQDDEGWEPYPRQFSTEKAAVADDRLVATLERWW
jgi:hypothetical protein